MQWKRVLLLATWMVADNWPPSGHAEERTTGYIFLTPTKPDYGPFDPSYREPSDGPQVIIVPDHNDGTTRSYIVVPAREPDYGPRYEPKPYEPTPEDEQ